MVEDRPRGARCNRPVRADRDAEAEVRVAGSPDLPVLIMADGSLKRAGIGRRF